MINYERSLRKHFHINKEYLLKEYIDNNKSANEIAINNGVKAKLIIKRLKRFGIKIRNIKESNSSLDVLKKREKTCIEKYGIYNVSKTKEVIQKIKDKINYETMGKKVSDTLKKKTKEDWINIAKKRKITMLKRYGVPNSACFESSRRKMRITKIEQIKNNKFNGNQWYPSYNTNACILIDKYGKDNGYNFQHAMNGGEFFIKNLGYWVDGYDKDNNIVIEVDEIHHFDSNGDLNIKDIKRQIEIIEYLKCEFIRIKNI